MNPISAALAVPCGGQRMLQQQAVPPCIGAAGGWWIVGQAFCAVVDPGCPLPLHWFPTLSPQSVPCTDAMSEVAAAADSEH